MLAVLLVEFVVVFEAVGFSLCEGCDYGCGCVVFVFCFCFCFFFVAVVLIVFLALVVEVCGGVGL